MEVPAPHRLGDMRQVSHEGSETVGRACVVGRRCAGSFEGSFGTGPLCCCVRPGSSCILSHPWLHQVRHHRGTCIALTVIDSVTVN
jgi:hypothetical protein